MQTKTESAIEAALNIGSGFILSLIVWQILAHYYRIPMPVSRNLEITSIFTVVSLTRSYVWRRIFNKRWRKKYEDLHNGHESSDAKGGTKSDVLCCRSGAARGACQCGPGLREAPDALSGVAADARGSGADAYATAVVKHGGT